MTYGKIYCTTWWGVGTVASGWGNVYPDLSSC